MMRTSNDDVNRDGSRLGRRSICGLFSMIVAGAVGMSDSNAQQADTKPEHHSDAHLQRVLNWTEAEGQAASDAARKLQADLNAAIAAKAQSFRIPPGVSRRATLEKSSDTLEKCRSDGRLECA